MSHDTHAHGSLTKLSSRKNNAALFWVLSRIDPPKIVIFSLKKNKTPSNFDAVWLPRRGSQTASNCVKITFWGVKTAPWNHAYKGRFSSALYTPRGVWIARKHNIVVEELHPQAVFTPQWTLAPPFVVQFTTPRGIETARKHVNVYEQLIPQEVLTPQCSLYPPG